MRGIEALKSVKAEQVGPGSPLRPGETFLLSVDPDRTDGRAIVWRLEEGPVSPGTVGFRGEAQRSLDVAARVAHAEVPMLPAPGALGPSQGWRARGVLIPGEGAVPLMLDGPSFGVAMCLAHVSRMLGLALPTHMVATACVSPDGAVSPVAGLAAKMRLLGHEALGGRLSCVLVPAAQAEEARTLAPDGVEVVGVSSLAEATAHAFDEERLEQHMRGRWTDPGERESAASVLFRVAIEGSNRVLSWGAVEKAAVLLDLCGEGDPWAWKVDIARRVAGRHAGGREPIEVSESTLRQVPRPWRMQLLAHAIQAEADRSGPQWETVLVQCSAALQPPGDEGREDLKLLGAMGRALAAWGRYEESEVYLRRAVSGWLDLDWVPEASYSLCELLRVRGAQGFKLDDALRGWLARFRADPRVDLVARAFVGLAVGRSQLQAGDLAAGLSELRDEACAWAHTPNHVQASRARWLAAALHRTEPERAHALWDVVAQRERAHRPTGRFANLLAVLDRAALGLADEAAATDALHALASEPGLAQEAARIVGFAGAVSVDERAAALRRHWRY